MKKRVVHFIHGLNTGGAETLVKNYLLGLDKSKYDCSVLCYEHQNSPYASILENAGIKIVYACDDMRMWNKRGLIPKVINHYQLFFVIRKKLAMLNPDILHTHLPVNRYVKFARLAKQTRLFHTVHSEPQKLWFNGEFQRKLDFMAAKWLVEHRNQRMIVLHDGMKQEVDKLFNVSNSIVLNNGICFSEFEKARDKYEVRDELGIPRDSFVIGHVGRFSEEKNHVFLVKVFKEVYEREKKAFLLMVGTGDEKDRIMSILENSPMRKSFLILSNRSDIPDLMQTMDVFVLPSLYEGFGIVMVEAQKSGLPCLASDTIPSYAKITDLVEFRSLDDSEKEWANAVLNVRNGDCKKDASGKMVGVPPEWDIKNVVKRLEQVYDGVI